MKAMDYSNHKQLTKVAEQLLRKDVTEKMRDCSRLLTLAACYVLHEKLGFGEKRLRVFVSEFKPTLEGLLDRYEMNMGEDGEWLLRKKLTNDNIPIDDIVGDGMVNFKYTITK